MSQNNDLIRRSDLKAAVDDICYSWDEETEVEGYVLIALVDKLPSVDAVEVVRCRDCIHYNPCKFLDCTRLEIMVNADFFCGVGVRR